MCLTIYIIQYTQILVIPLSHIHGVVDVKQYIVFHEADDSSDKDIYIEFNIPMITNGDYGNVQLHDHTSINLYTNEFEQLGFASSLPGSATVKHNADLAAVLHQNQEHTRAKTHMQHKARQTPHGSSVAPKPGTHTQEQRHI